MNHSGDFHASSLNPIAKLARTATERSQKFPHHFEGVSAPHRNHCGRGELETFSVPLLKEGTSSIGRS
jgi:hypothetical protein